jgi:[acyl-carrier-protein] S-malonyltransferase
MINAWGNLSEGKTMSRIVCIFPGQGSQKVGMGKDFFDRVPLAQDIFARADEALDFRISEICFSGPEDKLKLTTYTQPALLTVSFLAYLLLEMEPVLAAGHSLGEYSALVAAGCLRFEDAVRLVHKRGRYMQEAVPPGVGAMAAVLGASYADVRAAVGRASRGVVEIANWNSDEQVVIAGHREAVEEALGSIGGARSVMLPVSAPFHTSLMKSAEEKLAADLDAVEFRDLKFPVITNVDARVIHRGEDARDALKRQVSRPVLWHSSMMLLRQENVDVVVEVGPGKVLIGLLKKIGRGWPQPPRLCSVEDGDSLEKCRSVLSGSV